MSFCGGVAVDALANNRCTSTVATTVSQRTKTTADGARKLGRDRLGPFN